jgi:hypothetical protein
MYIPTDHLTALADRWTACRDWEDALREAGGDAREFRVARTRLMKTAHRLNPAYIMWGEPPFDFGAIHPALEAALRRAEDEAKERAVARRREVSARTGVPMHRIA